MLATNLEAVALPPIPDRQRRAIDRIYGERIRPLVHHLW